MRIFSLHIVFTFLTALIASTLYAQERSAYFLHVQSGDTLTLDSLSVLPNSLNFTSKKKEVSPSITAISGSGKIIIHESFDDLNVTFRSIPLDLSKPRSHKDSSIITEQRIRPNSLYALQSSPKKDPEFFEGLNKSGSLSRGMTVGNNQDAVLNSNLNLQLSGKINPNTTIRASITDNQIPVFADGSSQTLREFDRVFIEVENDQIGKVLAGDYNVGGTSLHFLTFNKRISGAGIQSPIRLGNGTLEVEAHGALSRGEFNRNTFQGQEGNQGPYKLVGKTNELTILIISGSERVYIDGQLLTRGMENDYIIDYSTGQVTFTAYRPITKDSRIVVEFQYTVQNYIRSIFYTGFHWKSKKWNHQFKLYSEQDAKNQPLRSLSDGDKQILSDAGNDITSAITPSWEASTYDPNKVLYRITDTLGTDSVFVFSTNPNDTLYEVFFSYIGANKGDYVATESSVNGVVYQFVPPIGGEPQGTHIPYSIIPRPEKIQVYAYQGSFKSKKNDLVEWELAHSHNDPNTYSNLDSELNRGYAAKAGYGKQWRNSNWHFQTSVNGEYNDRKFKTVERIRNVEFARDWNIQSTEDNDLFLGNIVFNAAKSDQVKFTYQGQAMNLSSGLTGTRHNGSIDVHTDKWLIRARLSYLFSKDSVGSTDFSRQTSRIQRQFGKTYLGLRSRSENNTSTLSTSVSEFSNYRFLEYSGYIGHGDTSKAYIEGGFINRSDDTIRTSTWNNDAIANTLYAESKWNHIQYGNIRFRMQYRSLDKMQPEKQEELNSITIRFQYTNHFFKRFLGWNSFYESSVGSEPLRNYKYLKVPKGTGTHIWIDYNNNGIEEIDEFERANYQDQADYIRIFVVSRDYVPVSKIRFSQQLDFSFRNLKSVQSKSFIGKLHLQAYLLLESQEMLEGNTNTLNPFERDISDSLLIQSIENFRSTLFFNRSNPIYGADYTILQNTAKNLLSYGIENVRTTSHSINLRWLVRKKVDFRLGYLNNVKSNIVPNFSSRDYQITSSKITPSIAFQGSPYLRWSFDYNIENSENQGEGGETLISQKAGTELQYNHPRKVNLLARFEYVNNDFVGNEFSPVGYEMLKGLNNGNNLLWTLGIQKNITSFLQVTLNYNARASTDNPIIHTGNMQVKAFF